MTRRLKNDGVKKIETDPPSPFIVKQWSVGSVSCIRANKSRVADCDAFLTPSTVSHLWTCSLGPCLPPPFPACFLGKISKYGVIPPLPTFFKLNAQPFNLMQLFYPSDLILTSNNPKLVFFWFTPVPPPLGEFGPPNRGSSKCKSNSWRFGAKRRLNLNMLQRYCIFISNPFQNIFPSLPRFQKQIVYILIPYGKYPPFPEANFPTKRSWPPSLFDDPKMPSWPP